MQQFYSLSKDFLVKIQFSQTIEINKGVINFPKCAVTKCLIEVVRKILNFIIKKSLKTQKRNVINEMLTYEFGQTLNLLNSRFQIGQRCYVHAICIECLHTAGD